MALRQIQRFPYNDMLAEAVQGMEPLNFGGLILTLHYCMLVECHEPFFTHEHQHPTYEMTMHLGGVPIHTYVQKTDYPLGTTKSRIQFIPAGTLHSRKQLDEGTSQVLSFSFRLKSTNADARHLCRRIDAHLVENGFDFPMSELQQQLLEALAKQPITSPFRKEQLRSLLRCFLSDFFAMNFSHLIHQRENDRHDTENNILNSIYLRLNGKPLTIATLSNAYHLCPRQLERRFQAKFGMTIGRWRRQLCMKNAKELLETTDRTVTDIAYSMGFSTLQGFTQFFRNNEGCSPTAYRARYAPPPSQ